MPIQKIVDELRNEELDVNTVDPDPLKQFQKWYKDALRAEVPQPDAMHLSTAARDGIPSGRFVIYKDPEEFGLGVEGFPFFTNYDSPKSEEIMQNPRVALTFYWAELSRQVRIEGSAKKLSEEASDKYFETRPHASKLSAWASPQSQGIEDRSELIERVEDYREKFEGQTVPRPEHWGGFWVTPHEIEFWQHRDDRLHDRVRYELQEDGNWKIRRLAP